MTPIRSDAEVKIHIVPFSGNRVLHTQGVFLEIDRFDLVLEVNLDVLFKNRPFNEYGAQKVAFDAI
jgi:hypothetical protein